MRTIYIASDHAGVDLKSILIEYISKQDYRTINLGTDSKSNCDYPDYAHKLCQEVLQNHGSQGILICGTGIGMSMTANKYPGIRAALCTHEFQAKATRQHNDANVLCLGARVTGEEICKEIVKIFLATDFEAGRHLIRINKIDK